MATDVGIKLKIEGEKEYKQSLKNIIDSQKEWESEIKAVESALESEASQEDKNRKKSELLSKSIESQEEKLGLMKDQLKKVEDAYGEDSKEAKTLRTNINKATTALNKMKGEAQKLTPKLKTIGETMEKAGKKMQKVGDNLTKYVTAPLTGIAAASVAAFNEVDAGLDIVTKKTGATGQALTDLQESARNVATAIPTDFETAGSAIGEVNTKFGLTGQELEDLSVKFVKFADLNDTDVSSAVDKTQKVMAAFGLETEDAGKLLDTMNKVGQNTGISMDTLSTTMVKNAASLKDMGMDAYDAAQFLGQIEMSGANTADVMKGMQKAMTEAAEDGMTLPEKLEEFNNVMQSSKSDADKLTFAMETFGTKAGQAIYDAYEQGSLNFENLATSADEFAGNIDQTYEDVKGANDDLVTSFNKIKNAGSRIGEEVLKAVAPLVEDIADFAESVGDKYAAMDEEQQKFVLGAVGAFGLSGPVVSAFGKTVEGAGKVAAKVGKLAGKIGEVSGASGALGEAAGALAGAGGPLIALTGTVAWAAFVVKSMLKPVEASNQDVKDLIEAQENNVSALDTAMTGLKEAIDAGNLSIEEVNNQEATALSIIDELEKLESQSSRTSAEEARMQTLVGQLNAMYPNLKVGIDRSTGSLSKSIPEIRKYVKTAKNMALLEAYTRASAEATDALVKANNDLYVAQKGRDALAEQRKKAELAKNALLGLQDSLGGSDIYKGRIQDLNDDINALDRDIAQSDEKIAGYKTTVDECTTVVEGWNAQTDEAVEGIQEETKAVEENTEAQKASKSAFAERANAVVQSALQAKQAMKEEQAKWKELYDAAEESIHGQIGLFDEWKEDTEVTKDTILANLRSQVDGLSKYSTNIEKLSKAAAQSGDENFKAFVQSLADMGISGADEVNALVDALENDKEAFNAILGSFVEREGIISDQIAPELAYIENDFQTGAQAAAAAFNEVFRSEDLQGMLDMKENAQEAIHGFMETFKTGGKDMAASVGEGFEEGAGTVLDNMTETDSALYNAGASAVGAMASGAESQKESVKTAASDAAGQIGGISTSIDESAKAIKSSANQSILGLIGGMVLNKLLLASTALGISGTIGNISTTIDGKKAFLKQSGQDSVGAIASGMSDSRKSELDPETEKVGKTVRTTTVTIEQMYGEFLASGRDVVRGLTTGMDWEAQNAYRKAAAIAGAIKTTINNALKINSPSKVMMETGRYVSEGLALGMAQQLPEVQKASAMLGRAAVPFGATQSDVIQLRAEAFGGLDVDGIYNAVRSGAMDGQQPVIISEKSFKRALVGMGVKVA